MVFFLTMKSLARRKLSAILCVFSIALSVALYLGISRVKEAAHQSFMSTVSGVDLIVGARSGDINLILYSLFHMGNPTNNIHYSSYEKIKSMPEVKWTIPIALGDSFQGHRVIGTNEDLFIYYQYGEKQSLVFSKGKPFSKLFDVVMGSEVAKRFNIGDQISLTHGSGSANILEHENIKFTIVGILKSTGTPLDQSVFVSLEAIEAIHLGWETGVPTDVPSQEQIDPSELRPAGITSFLLATKSKFQMLRLRQKLAYFEGEPLSAIIPGLALSRLWNLLGNIENILLFISLCVLLVSIISISVSLLNSLQARKKEMAILRSIGAGPTLIASLFMIEGPILTALGVFFGILILYFLGIVGAPILKSTYQINNPEYLTNFLATTEVKYLIYFLLIGLVSGILPAIMAYRTGLHSSLSDE